MEAVKKSDQNMASDIDSGKVQEMKTLQGFIDAYRGGYVHGWAWDTSNPGKHLKVEVHGPKGTLGSGEASIYREDLKSAGIGNGRFGFRIKISSLPIGQNVELMLVDAESKIAITDNSSIFMIESDIAISFHGMQWGNLSGEIKGAGLDADALPINLIGDNGDVVGGGVAKKVQEGSYRFNAAVPVELCDGMPHVITVALQDYPGAEASYADIFPSVLTPWEHISGSATKLNYPSIARTAGYRYDSLRKQLEHLRSSAAQVENSNAFHSLISAHQVVIEGWERRMNFPRLFLPEVVDPDVSIVIPVHNKFELTYHCLASLILAWNNASFEVIVIDDCSTDRTTELAGTVENVKLIVNEYNLGFLRSCNKAAREARGNYVVMLNNDTEVTSGWLDEMIDTFQRFDRVGMVGSKLIYPDGRLQEAGGIVWGNGQPWNLGKGGNSQAPEWNYARQADYLSGAALMIPRTIWKEVGEFSDEFAPAYYEDTDLAFKVRSAGYKTVYAPYSVVVHFEGMSNGRDESVGIKKNQAVNAPKFRSKWIDSYIGNGQPAMENVSRNKDRNVAYRVLMIDYAVPRPDHDAGSYAAVQEIRMLQANGCKVSFVAENMAHLGKYTDDLQKMGVECFYAPFYTSIHQVLQNRGSEYDLVYITRYDVAERYVEQVRQLTKAKVLFNNADLHFLRELRAALSAKHRDLSGPLATRDKELALMRKVDGILSYNATEHAIIMSHNLRSDNLYICPWVLDGRGHKKTWSQRNGIAFLGGYRHMPNVEAVDFFVQQVMPLLRKRLPGVPFHIYGSSMPASFDKYEAEDVILEGFVEELDDVFESCRVFVAPLLSGAGIKGKVLEAMSCGVPSVLSPVAAEATGLTHGVSAMIVEDPEDWVDAIVELYKNEESWQRISNNALALARNNYSFENGAKGMRKALEGVGVFSPRNNKSLVSN